MNPCIVPTPGSDPNGEDRWMNQHLKFVRQAQDLGPEVIFIGDSIIQQLQITDYWLEYFVPMHSANFGIAGDSTQNVLWRVQNGEVDNCSPKVIVLLVGTNNVQDTAENVAEGVLEIAKTIREKQAKPYIVILNLLPRSKLPHRNRDKNAKVNEILKCKAEEVERCQVIETGWNMILPNGEIDCHDMFDYLHLTASGYNKVFEPVYELLTQLLTENEAEPDLDKILEHNN